MIANMPAGYTVVGTIQMTDFCGPEQSRFFDDVPWAVIRSPRWSCCAARESTMDRWDDLHWDLVLFTYIPERRKCCRGRYDIYTSIGTTARARKVMSALSAFAAEVAEAPTQRPGGWALFSETRPRCGDCYSLGPALATLLLTDLNATTVLKP